MLVVADFYFIRADVLGDAACFTFYNLRIPDIVEQRCFTVVDVTHYSYDRLARQQIIRIIHLFLFYFHLFFGADELYFESELTGDHFDDFRVESLVDGNENAETHTRFDDVGGFDIHQ